MSPIIFSYFYYVIISEIFLKPKFGHVILLQNIFLWFSSLSQSKTYLRRLANPFATWPLFIFRESFSFSLCPSTCSHTLVPITSQVGEAFSPPDLCSWCISTRIGNASAQSSFSSVISPGILCHLAYFQLQGPSCGLPKALVLISSKHKFLTIAIPLKSFVLFQISMSYQVIISLQVETLYFLFIYFLFFGLFISSAIKQQGHRVCLGLIN